MKYWFFDGSDVVGPFTPQELAARTGFAATSLVCPEKFSEDQDSWKPAAAFQDFRFNETDGAPVSVPAASEEESAEFEQEMDTLLQQESPLTGELPKAQDSPSLEIPKKPAKPGPIEEYFNNIRGEDLGDILGIPDPNETSDMNLARALETQFGKTNPPTDKEIDPLERDPFDAFTAPTEPTLPPVQTRQAGPQNGAPERETASGDSQPGPTPAHTQGEPENEEQPLLPPAKHPERISEPVSVPISKAPEDEEILPLVRGQQPSEMDAPQERPAPEPAKTEPENVPQRLTASAGADNTDSGILAQTPPCGLPPLETADQASAVSSLPLLTDEDPYALQQQSAARPTPQPDEERPPLPVEPAEEAKPPEQDAQPQELVPVRETNNLSADAPKTPADTHSAPKSADGPVQAGAEETRQNNSGKPEDGRLPEPQINQVQQELNQTPEIKKFLTAHQIKNRPGQKKAQIALIGVVLLLIIGAALFLNARVSGASSESAEKSPALQKSAAVTPPPPVQPAAPARPVLQTPAAPAARPSAQDKALSVVQNYRLPGNKGTVASYFDRVYKDKLAQGYTASWSAEPLHQSTYIVKYRLTKTRMEPIVYVFQADAARGKLTGALNNVALDLVGKI